MVSRPEFGPGGIFFAFHSGWQWAPTLEREEAETHHPRGDIMSRPVSYLSLGALALALAAPSPLRAQAWGYQPNRYDYAAAWNFNRAYRHFLISPYAVR